MELYFYYKNCILEDFLYKSILKKKDFYFFCKSSIIFGDLRFSYDFSLNNFVDLYRIYKFKNYFFKDLNFSIKKSKKFNKKFYFFLSFNFSFFFKILYFFIKKGFNNLIKQDLFFNSFIRNKKKKIIWYFVFKDLTEIGFTFYDFFGINEKLYFSFNFLYLKDSVFFSAFKIFFE